MVVLKNTGELGWDYVRPCVNIKETLSPQVCHVGNATLWVRTGASPERLSTPEPILQTNQIISSPTLRA